MEGGVDNTWDKARGRRSRRGRRGGRGRRSVVCVREIGGLGYSVGTACVGVLLGCGV